MPESKAAAATRILAARMLWEVAESDREVADLLKAECAICAIERNPLCICPIPDEWIDSLALDLEGAIDDRRIEWFRTLKAGRPATTFVVEWEAVVAG
jgi:hypothetical protein